MLVGLRRHDTPIRFPEAVTVAENVPHDEVLRAWEHCTIAVVPSRWPDPSPLVAIEAMAAGRPVIASSTGGLPDLVLNGATGILVPPGDVSALRASIAQLLADPARRVRMGHAGRERAVEFTASALVPRIEQVYQEAYASPPQRSDGKIRRTRS